MTAEQDSEIMSQGQADSQLESNPRQNQNQQPPDGQTLQSLGRQSSIYSLTLDEFQHTLTENGKNFGSMNMDEFLNSIWTAEENQNQNQAQGQTTPPVSSIQTQFPNASTNKGIAKQPSLQGQGSMTIPEPLCRKTVDEVWSEIHKSQFSNNGIQCHIQNPNAAQKQPTFGEMTLEDFLVRAGIVREQHFAIPAVQPPPQQPSIGMYQNSTHPAIGPGTNFIPRPVMAVGGSGSAVSIPAASSVGSLGTYQPLPQNGIGEASSCVVGIKGGVVYAQPPPQPSVANYEGRVGRGAGGGFGQVPAGLGIGSPVSPVPSEGLNANQGDSGNQFGVDVNRGGRKRIIDGPVEKVVERRQRRMIKNRESAARSRARKQVFHLPH